jgi:DNA-binding NtrC family response regulator
VRRALSRELGKAFTVLLAAAPDEALTIIDANPDLVAVISDLNMDGVREAGLLLLAEVERRIPSSVRILVSGTLDTVSGSIRSMVAAARSVHQSFPKPWPPGGVLAAVQAELAKR